MNEHSRALLDKAARNLETSSDLLQNEDFEVAVSRAYYAMFYAAEAVLLEEGLEYSSHGALHAAFSERLTRTGRLDIKLHRYLLDAFRARQSADYDAPSDISGDDARAAVDRAVEFVSVIRRYLGVER
jgi:uncharacterized protein (UPF0332 family)